MYLFLCRENKATQETKMGVSYFNCDECNTIMNDCGHEYYCLKVDGKENRCCSTCADEIKQNKCPKIKINILVIRKLKVDDKREDFQFEFYPKLDKPNLKLLMKLTKNDFQVAIISTLKYKYESLEDALPENYKIIENFLLHPQESYNCFIDTMQEEHNTCESWFQPPKWENMTQRKIRLEDQIKQLERDIYEKNDEINSKKRKLLSL